MLSIWSKAHSSRYWKHNLSLPNPQPQCSVSGPRLTALAIGSIISIYCCTLHLTGIMQVLDFILLIIVSAVLNERMMNWKGYGRRWLWLN